MPVDVDDPFIDVPAQSAGFLPAVLDPAIIARHQALGEAIGEDLLGQLAVLFLADAASQILTLHRALAANDHVATILSAHTLRGASATMGAAELARLCADLEIAVTAGELSGGAAAYVAIDAELGRVRGALDTWRSTP
jgi:HPt (histidine-containing phosphotransfer) domain-containing protein